jgi:hypothetical protein
VQFWQDTKEVAVLQFASFWLKDSHGICLTAVTQSTESLKKTKSVIQEQLVLDDENRNTTISARTPNNCMFFVLNSLLEDLKIY